MDCEGDLDYFAESRGEKLFISREEKCVAKGDRYCEFVLTK